MTETDNRGWFPFGHLFELYARYAGEPESRREVYGYWTFVFGAVVAFVGVLVFLLGASGSPNYGLRETAIALAALGLPVALFGILLLFPVKEQGIYAAAVGTVIALSAVGGFMYVYPRNWAITTPDYSGIVISVYSVGVVAIVGVAALIPIVTGEKSLFFESEYERDSDYPGVMVGESFQDGLFSIYRAGEEWTWRLIEQDALAGESQGYISRLETEEAVEEVKRRVAEAGLMEIKGAAFRLHEAVEGQWRWLLMRADGSVVADSGESFEDRNAAATSLNELKEYGPDAKLLRIEGAAFDYRTVAGEWRWRLVDEDRTTLVEGARGHESEAAAEAAAEEIRGRVSDASVLVIEDFGVELFEAEAGWRWRLLDADETVLARGDVTFDSRRAAEEAVYDLLDGVEDAPVLDRGEPTYEVTRTAEGWRWRLFSGDERVVARSSDVTAGDTEAYQAAQRMAAAAADAETVVIDETDFEYYRGDDGWRWRLVTTDREQIAVAAHSFDSRDAVEAAIDAIKIQAEEAELIEYEDAAFQVYETGGEWRWRLIDEDGNVLADSGAEHDSREAAMGSMMTVKENAPNADLLEIETAAFELFERDGEWTWRLVDESGETTARGGTWHDSREAARDAMDRLTGRAPASRARSMDAATFQLYAGDDWSWRFVRPDGTILADSATTYGTRDEAETAIDNEVRGVATAALVHTIEDVAVQLVERNDRWEWRLLDPEHEELARSSNAHPTREDALDALSTIQEHVADAVVFERKETTFLLTEDEGDWEWKLGGADWDALATAPVVYSDRSAAEFAIDQIRSVVPEAGTLEYDTAAFELHEEVGRWHWRLIDENESVVAAGTEDYDSREAAAEGVRAVQAEVGDASILEVDTAAFELHEDAGEWRWRLVDEDGSTLAESLVAYDSRRGARQAMETVQEFAPESTTQVAE